MSFFAHTLAKYFSYVLFTYISICTMQNTLGVKRNKKNLRSCYELNFIFRNLKEKKFRMIKRSCLVLNRTQIQKTINYYFNQMTNTYDELYLVYHNQTSTNPPDLSKPNLQTGFDPTLKEVIVALKKLFLGRKWSFNISCHLKKFPNFLMGKKLH